MTGARKCAGVWFAGSTEGLSLRFHDSTPVTAGGSKVLAMTDYECSTVIIEQRPRCVQISAKFQPNFGDEKTPLGKGWQGKPAK
jgi:hypothetical protein